MAAVREFVAKYSLQDNITQQLAGIKQAINSATLDRTVKINADTSNLSSKINDSGSAIQKSIGGGAKVAEGAIKNAGKATEEITSGAKKAEGGISNITKSANNLKSAITNVAGALAGIATGGAIAGLSYLTAAKSDLYVAEVYKSIDANKKLGLSSEEVKARVAGFKGVGWTSDTTMLKNIQAAYTYGGIYAKGKETAINPLTGLKESMGRGEIAAQAAAKIAFNYVGPDGESLDPKDLLASVYRKGKLMKGAKNALALELGVSADDRRLDTVAGRIKLLNSHLGDGLTDQPWKIATQNLADLQKSIGESIAPVMKNVTGLLAGFIKMITAFPGGSALIGYLGIFIALASILSLIVSVGTPLVGLFMAIRGAMAGMTIATEGFAGAELLAFAPLFIIAGILLLVEQRTHIFSNALKQLGKTQLAKDFFKWFEEGGKWIDKMIGSLDKLYKAGKLGDIGRGALSSLGNEIDKTKNRLGGIFKDLSGSADLKNILKVVGMAALGPAGMMGAILGGGSPDKLQENLVKYMYNLYNLARTYFPWLNTAGEMLKKIEGIFEWLYSLLQGLFSWLKGAIPGAQKETYRQELVKKLPSNVELNSSGGLVTKPMTGKEINKKYGGGLSDDDRANLLHGGQSVSASSLSPKLQDLYTKYQNASSFATGIADAVKQGLSGMADAVAAAIKGIFPDFSPLTNALTDLTNWLKNHGILGNNSPNTGLGGLGGPGEKTAYDPNNSMVQYFYNRGSSQEWEKIDWTDNLHLGQRKPITEKDVPSSVVSDLQKSPIGSTIRRPGLVHVSMPGEEVVSAARVEHGPGAVARALDLLNNISSGNPMAVGAGTGATYNISVPIHQEFSGKISSNVDIEKLMRQVRKETATIAVKSVKDALSHRRT